MAFGHRNRDTSRVVLEDIEEIQKEIEFENKFIKNKPSLKGKKPIQLHNCVFFVDKDEDTEVAIERLSKTFKYSIL